jgi:hypothetical protein
MWGSRFIDPSFLVLGTRYGECSASNIGIFTPGKQPHFIRGWMSPRAGLEDVQMRKMFTLTGTRALTPR